MLVLDKAEAHVGVAILAEADAGGYCHLGIGEQFLGELQRSHLAVGLGDGRPDEHGGLGPLDLPADVVQAVAQHVAPRLVHGGDLLHALLGPLQGRDGRHLDGGEHAVVEVGLDARQRRHQGPVAVHEAHAPAGHVVALGQGEELHGNLLGTGHLQYGGRLVAIEDDVGISEIVDYPDVVLPGDLHHLLEELQFHALGGGVPGKVEHQHLGPRPGVLDRLLQLAEEVDALHQRHVAHVGTGDDEAPGMDGIGGIGHQHRVTGTQAGERQVRESLLRADGNDGLGLGIEVHVVTRLVPVAHGTAQAGDAARHGVAVGILALGRLAQLVHDMLGRGLVGIAHTEVDDVLAPRPRFRLQFVYDGEDIGGQPLDAAKLFHLGSGHELPLDRRASGKTGKVQEQCSKFNCCHGSIPTMKFSADLIDSPYLITAYEAGRIRLGEETLEHNLLLMPERLREPWPVQAIGELTPEMLEQFIAHRPDVVLFGTGAQQQFPPPALFAPLMKAGIGHEVMSTAAACRTYNILMGEGRPVLAALIL